MNNTLKSIGACLAGFFTVAILSVATDALFAKISFISTQLTAQNGVWLWWMLLIALVYRSIYTVFGGYIIAKLAPQNPMKHVIIVGIIGTVLSIAGMIAMWSLGNQWYSILIAATSIPLMWLGGKLAIK